MSKEAIKMADVFELPLVTYNENGHDVLRILIRLIIQLLHAKLIQRTTTIAQLYIEPML